MVRFIIQPKRALIEIPEVIYIPIWLDLLCILKQPIDNI